MKSKLRSAFEGGESVASCALPLLILSIGATSCLERPIRESFYHSSVEGIARWLQDSRQSVLWAPETIAESEPSSSLGTGSAGIALFFQLAGREFGRPEWQRVLFEAADQTIAKLPDQAISPDLNPSLYTGLAGDCWLILRAFRESHSAEHRNGALSCVQLIAARAGKEEETGAGWGHYNDVLFGDAGIGLVLLQVAGELHHQASLELAILVGERLLSGKPGYLDLAHKITDHVLTLATQDELGTRWVIRRPDFMAGAGNEEAFTGLFYGAAGYGILLVRLEAALQGHTLKTGLPDDPF